MVKFMCQLSWATVPTYLTILTSTTACKGAEWSAKRASPGLRSPGLGSAGLFVDRREIGNTNYYQNPYCRTVMYFI